MAALVVGAVVDIIAVELLLTDVVVNMLIESLSDVLVALDFAGPMSYFVAVERLVGDIAVGVLAGVTVNVSAAVMTALEFSVLILYEEFSC